MLTLGSIALLVQAAISPASATGQSGPPLKDGNFLYGVSAGGAHGKGYVYRYNVSTGVFKDLYDFCGSTNINGLCSDGNDPDGKLVIDTSGNLYGTTFLG